MKQLRKVFIDCDPGVDDTIALMMASSDPSVKIVGISTVFGNSSSEHTTYNALSLAEMFQIDAPVYAGAEKPLFTKLPKPADFHGKNGAGNVELPIAKKAVSPMYAWDAIYQEAKNANGELTLVTLGPLTNVAIALFKYEDLAQYIKEIVMMGGSADIGNELPFSEANVYKDAYAMQAVINSKIPLTMVGLNATETVRLTEEEYDTFFVQSTIVSEDIKAMIRHYKKVQGQNGDTGLVIHDAAAMAVALKPEIAQCEKYNVEIELTANYMLGRTIIDKRRHSVAPKNVSVALSIDQEAYQSMLAHALVYHSETEKQT